MLIGDEIEHVNNTANLQYSRPFDRGYLTNWDSEYKVWQRVLGEAKLKVCEEGGGGRGWAGPGEVCLGVPS